MKNEMFKIYGNKTDVKAIEKIIDGVYHKLSPSGIRVCAFAEGCDENQYDIAEAYVVQFVDKKHFADKGGLVTYSEGLSDADVSALNPQVREHTSSFEIMTDSFMGRVFLPIDSKLSRLQILVAFCSFLAAGCEASAVLKEINEYTMKRNDEK